MSSEGSTSVGATGGVMPVFERPPVEEVAIGAHFKDLDGFHVLHAGDLARQWAETYPIFEQWMPLPRLPDELGLPQPVKPSIQVDASGRMPFPRLWFLTPDQTMVRQVQRDRIVQNWRRIKQDNAYPHYAELRPRFASAFADLERLAWSQLAVGLDVTQCEVSYTNPLRLGGPFERVGAVQQVLAPWSGDFSDAFLPEPEMVVTHAQFPIRLADGDLVGRLHVSAEPAIHAPTGAQVLLLQLAARGRPLGEGLEGALKFLDLGHEWIVRGFTSFTTKQMHKEWGIRV